MVWWNLPAASAKGQVPWCDSGLICRVLGPEQRVVFFSRYFWPSFCSLRNPLFFSPFEWQKMGATAP